MNSPKFPLPSPPCGISSSWQEKTLPSSSQKSQPTISVSEVFALIIKALHFTSPHLVFFLRMIAWCSMCFFGSCLTRKRPQVQAVPAPYHLFKREMGGQSYFTVAKCLHVWSYWLAFFYLNACRISLISLQEQRHAVYFFFKSQLLQQLFFFFTCYQSVLGKKHFQCLILIKLFLHFNFLHTKQCSPVDLSFNQRLIFSSSPSYLTQLTLHWRCRKAANVIRGRAGMKFITCNLLLSNRA